LQEREPLRTKNHGVIEKSPIDHALAAVASLQRHMFPANADDAAADRHRVAVTFRLNGQLVGDVVLPWNMSTDCRTLNIPDFDSAEVCFCLFEEEISVTADVWRRVNANIRRGLRAVEFRACANSTDESLFLSPTRIIATNRTLQKSFQSWLQKEHRSADCTCTIYQSRQFLISSSGDNPVVAELYRGTYLTDMTGITRQSVQQLHDLLASYLFRNVHSDGRMTYLYGEFGWMVSRHSRSHFKSGTGIVALVKSTDDYCVFREPVPVLKPPVKGWVENQREMLKQVFFHKEV
ncbi:MAG: hypothetical protein KDA89_22355, partial [Planctomycetaceae bacterium]|nr:hypothetical protein [Planctomycetaceae bacterium]